MVQPELPEELLNLFIDQLQADRGDPSSKRSARLALQSCLLVSRSFCHRARRHLFSSIVLVHTARNSIPQLVHNLLQVMHSELSIGGVARYIKKVTISLTYDIPLVGPINESVDSSLVTFLRAMIGEDRGIRDLTFVVLLSGGLKYFEWYRMSVDLQKSIADTVCSAHLTDAHFFYISHIPRMVFVNAHLKRLWLKTRGWRSSPSFIQASCDGMTTPSASKSAPRLESFTTDHSYPIEYFEHDSIVSFSESPFSHLSTLTSSIVAPEGFIDCSKILDRAACTIKDLHLSFPFRIHEPPKPLDFQLFRQMRHLEIQYSGGATFGPFEDGIHHIFRLLDCPLTSNGLYSIHFVVVLSGAYSYPQDGLFSSAGGSITDWLALDSLLSGSKYSSVQKITFSFRINFINKPGITGAETFISETVDRLKCVFPTVLESKLLNIIVEVK